MLELIETNDPQQFYLSTVQNTLFPFWEMIWKWWQWRVVQYFNLCNFFPFFINTYKCTFSLLIEEKWNSAVIVSCRCTELGFVNLKDTCTSSEMCLRQMKAWECVWMVHYVDYFFPSYNHHCFNSLTLLIVWDWEYICNDYERDVWEVFVLLQLR